jgi:hypothetical protein
VISGSEVELHIQGLSEGPEKMGNELRTAIRSDMRRNAMFGKYVEDKKFSELDGSDGVMSWNE